MRDTEVKEKPFLDARTVGKLAAKTAVTLVDRHEGWFQVQAGNTQGWVRLLHVSSQPARTGRAVPSELETAARVATGRGGTGNIAVTTGTRGLTEEELRQAQPNAEAVQRLEQYGVDDAQAAAYAGKSGLARRQIPYPPAPR